MYLKKVLFAIGFVSIFIISIGTFSLYKSFHPNITFSRMIKDSDSRFKEEYYCEWLMPITKKKA